MTDRLADNCGLCECNPACGHAWAGDVRLCHADEDAPCSTDGRSCYVRWTVYKERPKG